MKVSKRYAKALLAVTKQKGLHSKAFAELQAVADGFANDASVKAYFEKSYGEFGSKSGRSEVGIG